MTGWREGGVKQKGTLDDYAYMICGMLELYFSGFSPKWLEQSLVWTERMIQLFASSDAGFYMTGSDVNDLPVRQIVFYDSALPSGNAVAASNLIRLSVLCNRDDVYGDLR